MIQSGERFFAQKGREEEAVLAAQADCFAGAKRQEKASACSAWSRKAIRDANNANESFGDCGAMSELKLQSPRGFRRVPIR